MTESASECEHRSNCFFGSMTKAEAESFIESAVNRAIARAFEGIGLKDPEARTNIRELIELIKNYKTAKRATTSALWAFLQKTGMELYRFGSKAAAILLLIYLLYKAGVDPEKVEQLTRSIK